MEFEALKPVAHADPIVGATGGVVTELCFRKPDMLNDDDMARIADLSCLESLCLDCANISDEGLRKLMVLKRLGSLSLCETNVSSEGLDEISGLRDLRVLELRGTNVDDRLLDHLKAMPNLETVNLALTRATEEGLRGFQRHMMQTGKCGENFLLIY